VQKKKSALTHLTLCSTICDPYLNIFRGIIPPLGGTLDLSPILAFLVLNALSSTAAALPAELPDPAPPTSRGATSSSSVLTANRRKWMRRIRPVKSQEGEEEM
jgi:YggT family protein